jgi:hypothetical protein
MEEGRSLCIAPGRMIAKIVVSRRISLPYQQQIKIDMNNDDVAAKQSPHQSPCMTRVRRDLGRVFRGFAIAHAIDQENGISSLVVTSGMAVE